MKNVKALWYAYFEYFLSHGNYTKFYRQIRNSSFYNLEAKKEQGKSFPFFSNLV